jgi:eukaryotic-like serine/threonine-protein kinase
VEPFGRYQLLRRLATGGMAEIFLARQVGPEGFEKQVVVKRILPHLAQNEDFVAMFLDEARIAARLDHPNLVQIFDLGSQEGAYFIAMEYVRGEDVRAIWKRAAELGQPVPQSLVCRIGIEACAGLDHAHKQTDQAGRPLGIIHRDVSPQNLLVSFEGAVKVADFGIAKAADKATVTRSGVLKGKYSYMSPEQAAGQPLDHRTDIFALGVVLYELLTGVRLFKRASDLQTLGAVTECQVAPPSAVDPRVPDDLGELVLRALAKDRSRRYPEARQLGAALEGWLLAHRLPSSASHLAEFMHHLYADRLAKEPEAEARAAEDEARGRRPRAPLPGPSQASPSPRLEPTVAARPRRGPEQPPAPPVAREAREAQDASGAGAATRSTLRAPGGGLRWAGAPVSTVVLVGAALLLALGAASLLSRGGARVEVGAAEDAGASRSAPAVP